MGLGEMTEKNKRKTKFRSPRLEIEDTVMYMGRVGPHDRVY